jgi:hypothetical protein
VSAIWGTVLLDGGAVQHVRMPVTVVAVPAVQDLAAAL